MWEDGNGKAEGEVRPPAQARVEKEARPCAQYKR